MGTAGLSKSGRAADKRRLASDRRMAKSLLNFRVRPNKKSTPARSVSGRGLSFAERLKTLTVMAAFYRRTLLTIPLMFAFIVAFMFALIVIFSPFSF